MVLYFNKFKKKFSFGYMCLPKRGKGKVDIEQTKQMVDMYM